MAGWFKQAPSDDVFETLKSKLRISDDEIARNGSSSLQIAVAVDKQSGDLVIRFGDRSYSLSKTKALALVRMIEKKASELT